MKQIIVCVTLFCIFAVSAFSQEINLKDEVIRINSIQDSTTKLQALSDISVKLQQESSPDYVTQWTVEKFEDKMNNRTVYNISTPDKNDPNKRLTIEYTKCLRESQDSVLIFLTNHPGIVFNNGRHPVEYKYGDKPVSYHEQWAYTQDKQDLVASFPAKLISDFSINDEMTLVLVTGQNNATSTRLFEVYGFQKALVQYGLDQDRILALAKKK